MGSSSDSNIAKSISEKLEYFGIKSVQRIASAHKTTLKVLDIIAEFESKLLCSIFTWKYFYSKLLQ